VTAAAPNVNFAREVYDLRLMANTVRTIFMAPKISRPRINTLILGAWGCGAFGGNPHEISDLFATAIAEEGLGHIYQEVHFAIPADKNGVVFRETFRSKVPFQEIG